MVVTAASAAATAAVTTGTGRAVLGSIVLLMFMGVLVGQEIFGYAGNDRLKSIQKALMIAAVPLACAVGVVLVQHISSAL